MSSVSPRACSTLAPWLAVALAAAAAHAQPGSGALYGARDARKCRVPSSGAAPTPAQAALAFVCRDEGVSDSRFILDDELRVLVGRPRPYEHGTDGFQDINVRTPIYPIRGSFVRYICTRRDWVLSGKDPNRNCDAYPEPEAEGICYTTTFGDLWCGLSSRGGPDARRDVPPPRS